MLTYVSFKSVARRVELELNIPLTSHVMIEFKLHDNGHSINIIDCLLNRNKNSIKISLAVAQDQTSASEQHEIADEKNIRRNAYSKKMVDRINTLASDTE